jgi:membrane protein DedA with SNARE-associated domain
MDQPATTQAQPPEANPLPTRISDGWALGLLGAWFIVRAITQRVGLAVGPQLLDSWPWVIPLLNNSSLLLIQAGTGTQGRPGMFVAALLASVFMSTTVGLILYWAGWRFGHKLAEMSKRPGSPWAGIWNPKQVARAERWMDKWGIWAVFFGRATELFVLPVILVAGAGSMRFRRFLVAHTLGAFAFATQFLIIGGVAQTRWPWLKDWIADVYGPWALRIGIGLLILLVVAMGLGQLGSPDKKSNPKKDTDGEPAPDGDQASETTAPAQAPSDAPSQD